MALIQTFDTQSDNEKDFVFLIAVFILFKQVITVDFMKECLVKWATRSEDNPDEPARFITTLLHIKGVYRFLQENLPPKHLQDLLHHQSAIFYPVTTEATANPDCLFEGKFLGKNDGARRLYF